MTKRVFDLTIAGALLALLFPVMLIAALFITLADGGSPLYLSTRIGRHGRAFPMLKLRTMTRGADQIGIDSTAGDDPRITPVGHILRRTKLDELPQLLNVLAGHMSLVGPRPNVRRETDLYSQKERQILSVRPGITDLASVVFSDEADILAGSGDPDIAYNQLIRPGKSRLAIFYACRHHVVLDIAILLTTALSLFSRRGALRMVGLILGRMGAGTSLIEVARRRAPLKPSPPPGLGSIVTDRGLKPV